MLSVYDICSSSLSSSPLTFFPAQICSLSGLAETPDFVFSTDRPNGLGQDDEVSLAPHAIWWEELRLQCRPPCEKAPTATARDSAPKTHLGTLFSHRPPAVQERLWHSPGTVCFNTEQSKGSWHLDIKHSTVRTGSIWPSYYGFPSLCRLLRVTTTRLRKGSRLDMTAYEQPRWKILRIHL